MRPFVRAAAAFAGAALFSGSVALATPSAPGTHSEGASARHALKRRASGQHVIVIVQENRSIDNLFQTFPGADTQNFGADSKGNKVALTALPLGTAYDPGHGHKDFVAGCNATRLNPGHCRMNGFDKVRCFTSCPPDSSYTYVDPADIVPYTQIATQFALADHVLQPNEGPSFPGHIYLVAGQSGTPGSHWSISENPTPPKDGPANCLASLDHTVTQIDMMTAYPGTEGNAIYPCIDPPTIFDELDQAGIGWRYYTPSLGSIWTAPLAVNHLFMNPDDYGRVVRPETTVLSDIQNHTLQPVSYVIPTAHNSDHAGPNDPNGGPAWVASIVNAIGTDSTYWPNTTILVVWDDWGGWFDHVVPTHAMSPFGGTPDPYEYGFRVPLLAVGTHVKQGYISHKPRSSAAILHFIEDVYGLGTLGELDAQTDNLSDMFTLGHERRFGRVSTNGVTIREIMRRPPDPTPVDED